MAQPRVKEPQTHSKDPPPQTIILEPTPLTTSFQREERSVSTPQNSPFQLLEPMPAETPHKSRPMFLLGFFTPFIVWFLTIFALDLSWELFGRRVTWWLEDASCYALPLLYIGTLIFSFAKGSKSFGKGLLAAAAVPVLLFGGLFLFIYIEYG